MQVDAQHLSVSPESLGRKHEVSEKRVRNVLFVGAAAAILVIFSLAVCGICIDVLARTRPMQRMEPLGLILAPDLKPLARFPKPNLDVDDDHGEMLSLREGQEAKLGSYGWVDRSNGIVRIPIDRAMDLLLQRGLPTRTGAVSETDGSTLKLIQKIPEQP